MDYDDGWMKEERAKMRTEEEEEERAGQVVEGCTGGYWGSSRALSVQREGTGSDVIGH